MDGYSPLTLLGILWAAVTFILIALVIYRSIVGIHEDDQLFLARAGAGVQKEQIATLKRIRALDAWIKVFVALSGLLLLAMAGIWVYQGFHGPGLL